MTALNISIRTPEDSGQQGAVASYTEGYTFTIKNGENFPIAFKAFTQNPALYTFNPSSGVAMPQNRVSVTIRLRVPTFYISQLEGNDDIMKHTTAIMARRKRRRKASSDPEHHHRQSVVMTDTDGTVFEAETASEGDSTSEYSTSDEEDTSKGKKSEGGGKKKHRRKKTRLEKISSYFRTRVDSGLFKIEIKVINAQIGVGVAETAFLSRQHTIEEVARKELENRDKEAFLEKKKREFSRNRRLMRKRQEEGDRDGDDGRGGGSPLGGDGDGRFSGSISPTASEENSNSYLRNNGSSSQSSSQGSSRSSSQQQRNASSTRTSGASNSNNFNSNSLSETDQQLQQRFSEKDALEFYDPSTFTPSADLMAETIATIRKNAASLFEHLWAKAIPHSTHTIICRTMREDIHTFFAKIATFQQADLESLQVKCEALKKAVNTLQKEAGDINTIVSALERRQFLVSKGVPIEFVDAIAPSPLDRKKDNQRAAEKDVAAEAADYINLMGYNDNESTTDGSNSNQTENKAKKPTPKIVVKKLPIVVPRWLGMLAALAAFWVALTVPPSENAINDLISRGCGME